MSEEQTSVEYSEESKEHRLQEDYSTQFKFARVWNKGRSQILDILEEIADDFYKDNIKRGIIIVFGMFDNHDGIVDGVVQMGTNPITTYKSIYDDDFKDFLLLMSESDGALLVNRTGQIIAARTYLVVDHPDLVKDEECGTKHRAAASFSKRPEIQHVFTLSEETLKVRQWYRGEVEHTHDPHEIEEAATQKKTKSRSNTNKAASKKKQEESVE